MEASRFSFALMSSLVFECALPSHIVNISGTGCVGGIRNYRETVWQRSFFAKKARVLLFIYNKIITFARGTGGVLPYGSAHAAGSRHNPAYSGKACPVRTFGEKKRRYAYLFDLKPEKFQQTDKDLHSGSHAYRVGCYHYIRSLRFLRTAG